MVYGSVSTGSGWPGTDLRQPVGPGKDNRRLSGPIVFAPDLDRSMQGVGLTWQQGHPHGAHVVYAGIDLLDASGKDVTEQVHTGDRLIEIDGFDVTTHQSAIVEKMIVGERNTIVELTFNSARNGLVYSLRLRRHVPPPPPHAFILKDEDEQVVLSRSLAPPWPHERDR